MTKKKQESETEWEPAFDALKRLYPHHGGYYATKLMLAEMLKDGELDAKAGSRWVSNHSSLSSAWRNRADADIEEDVLLDHSDFGWGRYWTDDVSNWRWNENRFVLTRAKKQPKRMILVDVAFRSAQITEMMPSNRKGIGGANIRVKDVAKIGVVLIEFAKEGYFTANQPGSAKLHPRFKNLSAFVAETLARTDNAYNVTQARNLLGPVYEHHFPRSQDVS